MVQLLQTVVEKYAYLALSEGEQLAPGDPFDGICEYTQPQHRRVWFSDYTWEYDVDSGIMEGQDCDDGE